MDQETIELLKTLDASKRVIVVLFKWRYPFFTNLEAMKKPQDAALIGYFARQIQSKLTNEQLAHFDKVLWFDADYGDFARVYVNSDETKVPQIEEFVKELVEVVSPTKLHLLETEEFMIHPVAALRQKYGVPGPTNADLTRLRDKQWLKEHAATHSLPSAKFIVFDGSQKNSAVTSAEKIEATIGSYPMFTKPIHGVGGGGGGRIDGRAQLDEWVTARGNDVQTYLIEEYVEGREFWAVFALLQSGERRLLYLIHLPADQSMHASLSAGRPIAYIGLNVKDVKFEFPGIRNFLDDVITAFDPPHPHIFCIQGFQTKPAAHEY
uniref:ATP-grasp domain-containing protein n=1 Tax=Plectus sambesii TaxID=2011161 RepID=A0A914VWT1_9BILA